MLAGVGSAGWPALEHGGSWRGARCVAGSLTSPQRCPGTPPCPPPRSSCHPADTQPAACAAPHRQPEACPSACHFRHRLAGAATQLSGHVGKLAVSGAACSGGRGAWQAAALLPGAALSQVEVAVASSGAYGPLLFALFYALTSAFFLPAAPLSIASGYLFGPYLGALIASLASTAGCALAFALSRYVARPLLEPRLRAFSNFRRVDRAVAAQAPAKTVFLLRLSPFIPLTLLSYMLGLTSITFWPYLRASWAGLLPICTVYALLGRAGRGALQSPGGPSSQGVRIGMAAVGLAATLTATRLIAGIASDALSRQEVAEDVA